MQHFSSRFSLVLTLVSGTLLASVLSSCAATEKTSAPIAAPTSAAPAKGQPYSGWYMEHAGKSTFQPCGQTKQWRVSAPADLVARAKKFGLEQDTPVYVQLLGTAQGDAIAVSRVQQFGSPTPVRNCALTGVVLSSAPQSP
ncbi:MAG: hypothetical protein ABIQ97_00500 [Lysobacteraceae bacterium]